MEDGRLVILILLLRISWSRKEELRLTWELVAGLILSFRNDIRLQILELTT